MGEQGEVAVAGGEVPPVGAHGLDALGLEYRGEDHAPVPAHEAHELAQTQARVREVLQHFDAGDQVEGPLGLGLEGGIEGVPGFRPGNALGAEALSQPPGPAPPVQDRQAGKGFAQEGAQAPEPGLRPQAHEIVVHVRIVLVVDVGLEFIIGPVIAEPGEEETAVPAAIVGDPEAGRRQGAAIGVLAALVEIHVPEQRRQTPAAFAERLPARQGPGRQFRQGSHGDSSGSRLGNVSGIIPARPAREPPRACRHS